MYMLTIEKPPEGQIRLPREGLAAIYRERLAGFGGPVAEHRELVVDDDAVVYRPVENLIVPPPWHRGRVVLIGDAAHADLAARRPGRRPGDRGWPGVREELAREQTLAEALDAYVDRRYERCRRIVEGSEAIGAWEQDHSLPIDPSQLRMEVTMAAMAPI